MKEMERTVCGLAAVEALFARDPESIKRLFFDEARSRRVSKISRHLARTKRIYRLVPPAELEKIAGTLHHGGIVAVATPQPLSEVTLDHVRRWSRARETLLVLDRVGNPHNLGALARTAAFLGVKRLILRKDPAQAKPSDAAYRVAEGGLEHLEVFEVGDLPRALKSWQPFFEIIGTCVEGAESLALLPPRTKNAKPVALVLGNEERGMAPEVRDACTLRVTIPGSGQVESLNVSVAGAILLWHLQQFCR